MRVSDVEWTGIQQLRWLTVALLSSDSLWRSFPRRCFDAELEKDEVSQPSDESEK